MASVFFNIDVVLRNFMGMKGPEFDCNPSTQKKKVILKASGNPSILETEAGGLYDVSLYSLVKKSLPIKEKKSWRNV